ncbi:mucin-binding protein [uncultured Limosilactobacillus sp.]|uniref:mucin-binding protein n=1 Tax=uncultured Limosilactobacillus sp. TaxID=2837629 RepID=UPI0025FC53D6|nr:YSIRK-type signal peptide-containing protein [uncultured Limosilactobacillus sp.]
MVSKNNRQYLLKQQAKQRPHYGLRRLTVGVASVLLSTTFYFGLNTAVHAATVPAGTTTTNVTTKTTATNERPTIIPNNQADHSTTTTTLKPEATIKAADQANQVNGSAQTNHNQQRTLQQSLVSTDRNAQLIPTSGNVTISPAQSTLELTFNVANYHNGDQYRILIPKADLWSGHGTAVTAQGGPGFTVKVDRQNDGSYVVTDAFTTNSQTAAGIVQSIDISLAPVDQIHELGNLAKKIIVQKNGKDDSSLTVFENISPKITVGNVTRQLPDGQVHGQVMVNQDVEYWLPVTNSYANLPSAEQLTNQHFGTFDLTLNVPAHFQANLAAMKNYFAQRGLACGNITQQAAGSPIILTGITTADKGAAGIQIIGKYVMAAPGQDQTVQAAASNGDFHFYGGQQQVLTVPAWSDTILGNSTTTPVGQAFTGKVDNANPDSTGTYDANTLPVQGWNGDLNTIEVENVDVQNYHNVHFQANFSRGYAVNKVQLEFQRVIGQTPSPALVVKYYDGSSATVNGQSGIYYLDDQKQLQSIQWVGDFNTGELIFLSPSGTVANGMTINDKLTAGIGLAVGHDPSQMSWSNTQELVGQASGQYAFQNILEQNTFYRDKANPAGIENDNDGYIEFQYSDWNTVLYDLTNPRVYLVLPQTVDPMSVFNAFQREADTIRAGKVTMYQRNGKTIVEYNGAGTKMRPYDLIFNIPFQLKTGVPASSDTGTWFISADNLVVNDKISTYAKGTEATPFQMAMLDGAVNGKTRAFITKPVKIETAAKQQNGELAQGNQDQSLTSQGTSDDKQGADMVFSHYVVSEPTNKISQMTNVVIITNLPQTDGANKHFGFHLNPNGVRVINSLTGQTVGGATILYSTQLGNDNNQKTNLASYRPASQVTDWTQIKSVAVKFNKLANAGYQVVLEGIDPTLATDAGNTGVLTGQTWCDEIPIPMYNAPQGSNMGSSAAVKVQGTSTIHIKYRYKDIDGVQHILDPSSYHPTTEAPLQGAVTYTDNQDHLNLGQINQVATDLINSEGYRWYVSVNLSEYRLLDPSKPQATENSTHGSYANGAPNKQLSISDLTSGKTVKYYMDGDVVIYDLIARDEDERAQVSFADDTDHNNSGLPTPLFTRGKHNDQITFDDLQNDLNLVKSQGYDVVKVTGKTATQVIQTGEPQDWTNVFGKFDNQPENDDTTAPSQQFVIHLQHHLTKTPVERNYQEIIHYKYNDAQGHHTDRKAGNDQSPKQVTFTQTTTRDEVTGQTTTGDWDAKSKTFDPVNTIPIKGYTPDQTSIQNVSVTPNADPKIPVERTVYYTPDAQKATVTYIDDTDGGKHLEAKDLTGVSDEDSGYKTQERITHYQNSGYDLVSDGTHGQNVVFDHDDKVNQSYEVHFKHHLTPAPDVKKSFKEVVHYQYKNSKGQPTGKQAHADQSPAKITFTQTGNQKDNVTGNIIPGTWDAKSKTFDPVDTPPVQGYTPDHTSIKDVTVTPNDDSKKPVERTVYYTPDAQKATVTYIDDTDHQTLETKDLTGFSDEDSGYQTKDTITRYQNLGYDFVSDTTSGKHVVFDHDDKTDQSYEVHFKHGKITVNPEKPGKPGQPINKDPKGAKYPKGTDKDGLTHVVNQTITYVNSDGTPVTNGIKPHHDSRTFEETKVIDKVTGEVLNDTWSLSQTFPAVPSPTETGYTPDRKQVAKTPVEHDTKDITEKVTYTPDAQRAIVKYIDDTTGQTLATKTLNGYSNGHSGYTTEKTIQSYKDSGYDFVSDSTKGKEIIYDTDDNTDQSYEVHFKHGTEPVSETTTVTRVIHYRYDDGTPAQPDGYQTVTFQRTGTKDRVTNQISWQPWTPTNQQFSSLVPPTINGYVPSVALIPGMTVSFDTPDQTVTVVYHKVITASDQAGTANGDRQLSTTAMNGITNHQSKQRLPQTGNHPAQAALGLGLSAIFGMIGLLGSQHRKNEK